MTITNLTSVASAGKHSFLDKETERALAVRWRKRGDVAARDELVLAHKPYADKVARAYAATYGVSARGLEGHSFEGLLIAAAKFDPDLGLRFNTYARHWVRTKVQEHCGKIASSGLTPNKSKSELVKAERPNVVSFDEPIPTADEDDGDRHDLVADTNALGEDDLLEVIHNDKVRGALLGLDLTLRDRRVVEARLADRAPKEIAAELGITRARVDQIWYALVDRAAGLLTNPRTAKDIRPAPAKWYVWSDRPPGELLRNLSNITHISQIEPAWFKAQRWPGDHASFRTERRVEIVEGPARAPLVASRWVYAHHDEAIALKRRRVDGREMISLPTSKAAGRKRTLNTRPFHQAKARNHAANRALLIDLGIDGNVRFNCARVAFIREKCWSYRKPMLTEADVIEVFKAIPPDAIEPALAELNPHDQRLIKDRLRPMSIPALARLHEQSYAKILPALYRAAKRLEQTARLVVPNNNVVLLVTRAERRAAA